MTDTLQPTPEVNPSEQQLLLVRQHLFASVMNKFRELISEIEKLPFDKSLFANSILYYNSGNLWTQEILFNAPIVAQRSIPANQVDMSASEGIHENCAVLDNAPQNDAPVLDSAESPAA